MRAGLVKMMFHIRENRFLPGDKTVKLNTFGCCHTLSAVRLYICMNYINSQPTTSVPHVHLCRHNLGANYT